MARILIIEDNERLGRLIAQGLDGQGHVCDRATSLVEADEMAGLTQFDLLVLDLGLPDGDGLDWLRAHRIRNRAPVLILTARDALEDRIRGLDAGADDYLVKPFEMDELAARLRALLRRPGARAATRLCAGPVCFDATAHAAQVDGRALDLTRREADLLELLMRHVGKVVRRHQIEDALYAMDHAVTPNAVEATMSRLRRKLDESGAGDMMHTVRGVGYMMREQLTGR